jgi:hypothetical protein
MCPFKPFFFIVLLKNILRNFLIHPSKNIKKILNVFLYYYVKVYTKKIPKYVIKKYFQIVFLVSKLLVNNSYKF